MENGACTSMVILLLLIVALVLAVAAMAVPVATAKDAHPHLETKGVFEEVLQDLKDAIVNRGYVVDFVGAQEKTKDGDYAEGWVGPAGPRRSSARARSAARSCSCVAPAAPVGVSGGGSPAAASSWVIGRSSRARAHSSISESAPGRSDTVTGLPGA